MAFHIAGLGIGEGGGRLAMAMARIGFNIGAINTNAGDLRGLSEIPESKKLLLSISDGGSGKDPNFVKESLKNPEYRKQINAFITKLLKSTPLFTMCPHCNSEEKLKDTEAVSFDHVCSVCNMNFSIKQVLHREEVEHNYLFIFACLGGGSGSGLISDIIDICYTNFNLPIAVICTLPGDSEDTISKINAISIYKELYNKYALPGIVSPLITVDNQKMMEMYNLPLGSMYLTINNSVAEIIKTFNDFSDPTSSAGKTLDVADTTRLWEDGGCCTLGKFTVGNRLLKKNKYEITVETFDDFNLIDEAMDNCTFVDGFDLTTADRVGVIVVAPKHLLDLEESSNCIKYVYGRAKQIIGDGIIYNIQYDSPESDCIEFYLIFNGLKYPEERFKRMWDDIKQGKAITERKKNRIDGMTYDIGLEASAGGRNLQRLQALSGQDDTQLANPGNKVATPAKAPTKICTNCIIDSFTKKSMGRYNGRGPVPFNGRICPVCKGSGRENAS